jgi:hypothetical protein
MQSHLLSIEKMNANLMKERDLKSIGSQGQLSFRDVKTDVIISPRNQSETVNALSNENYKLKQELLEAQPNIKRAE